MKPTVPTPGSEELSLRFGFGDDSWQSHLANALHVRMPDAPPGYTLIDKIGEGGQGAVYKARQNTTGRLVAAKRLYGGTSTLERFERELHALSTFSHPAIVSVIAAERAPDQRWLILDWIDGIPVDAWAHSLPATELLRTALQLVIEICDGVQHAHSRGVIHRDLKPSNILVDAQSRPHILDFGIAKIVDERGQTTFTATGSLLGTLGYIAPEQLTAQREPLAPDIRIDVYALGAVLYKLLTGKDPLTAISGDKPSAAQAFAAASEHRSPPRPSSLNSSLSRDLDVVMLKALQPDPELRYPTVDALRTDLQNILEKRPVAAQPPTIRYLARTFIHRQRMAVSIAAVALLFILSLTIFLGILSLQLSRRSTELAISSQQAKEQERNALALAENRSKTAEALSAMVESLAGVYSGDATIEMLDGKLRSAVAKIDAGALAGDIDAEIMLRGKLRTTFQDRGMVKEALEQSIKHFELTSRRLGPRSRAAASSLIYQASVYNDLGDYAEAERTARLAIEIELSLKEPGALPNTGHISTLASILHCQGRYSEAEELYRQRLVRMLDYGKFTKHAVARAKRNVGGELLHLNKLEEAEAFTQDAIKDLTPLAQKDGSAEDSLLKTRRNLALIRLRQGRLEEAETLQRQVIAGMINLHGGRHLSLLQERVHLATILLAHDASQSEKRAEALALLHDTEALFKDRVQPTSEFLVSLHQLLQAHTP